MDPDRTLDRILNLAQMICAADDVLSEDVLPEDPPRDAATIEVATNTIQDSAPELAQAILDLSAWIERRGFLPDRWRKQR